MSIPLVKNNRKVLVSFKCNSSLKTDLCVESGKLGITLSSYVENIVENQSNHQIEVANLKKQVFDLSLIFRANKSTLSAPKKTGKVKCLI